MIKEQEHLLNKKIKVLFTVQGEGRGHLTQAIAVQNILLCAGYEVCLVLIGSSTMRKIPDFFFKEIKAEIVEYKSPNLISDSNLKSTLLLPSFLINLFRFPVYLKSIWKVSTHIKRIKPDIVINFYDPLIGLYYLLFNPKTPLICIGHQYIFNHPDFEFPKGFKFNSFILKNLVKIASFRAKRKLALSFYKLDDHDNVFIIPPLLRQSVFDQQISSGKYILIYLLNSGYMADIINWHKIHPDVILHCFTDKSDIEGEWAYDSTLSFHQINDRKFLEMMAGSLAFASTAGFESICEAMYFGKPTLLVPVDGHIDQCSNAYDAVRHGAGIYMKEFNLDKLIEYLPEHNTDSTIFRAWADSAKPLLLKHIESTLEAPVKLKVANVVYR